MCNPLNKSDYYQDHTYAEEEHCPKGQGDAGVLFQTYRYCLGDLYVFKKDLCTLHHLGTRLPQCNIDLPWVFPFLIGHQPDHGPLETGVHEESCRLRVRAIYVEALLKGQMVRPLCHLQYYPLGGLAVVLEEKLFFAMVKRYRMVVPKYLLCPFAPLLYLNTAPHLFRHTVGILGSLKPGQPKFHIFKRSVTFTDSKRLLLGGV